MNYRKVNEKGRINIRLDLEKPIFTLVADREIILYSKSEFEKIAEEYEQLSMFDEEARKIRDRFFSHIFGVYYDKQGRITLNRHLRRVSRISLGEILAYEMIAPGIIRIVAP